jgi:sterol desaturase/sphingolipid hydroxylase (fatty acid hydroxylase superfamily)
MPSLAEYETVVRLGVFAAVMVVLAVLEAALPRKKRSLPRAGRWFTNLLLVVIDSIVLRVLVPVSAMTVAVYVEARGWGLYNFLEWPQWLEIVMSVLLLDMLVYWQHVLAHRIAFIWNFHRVHHADPDFDVTTALRFHPVEIVLSMLYKFVCIWVLGPAAVAVFIFEVLLNACAMFNHANLRLPGWLDRLVRTVLVTPDMHRVHHSVLPHELNSNYAFGLSVWDRLFATYTAQPEGGHKNMRIGLAAEQNGRPASLSWSLFQPFLSLRGGDKHQ